jgi:hypothetical protein
MTIRLALAALALSAPAFAQDAAPKPFSLEQQTALRCSAAFAVGATLQQHGQAGDWPPLASRGREFFVRAMAQLMDDTGRTREQVAEAVAVQAKQLSDRAALDAAMPPCLLLLDASGL